ncbi:hypothetical protein [Rhizobium phage RHph_I40]|uniref:Uncharacterized protein n=1 Tax=Rhizobium phage RHph_I38 TaxID=2509734 RepID=A0A7S5REB9_9CAUD|nr:hypothetical protein EVC01_031 [Rhizobium phage RHph_I38]QXV73660.1 hypothetical protein [Rhizobium phage RHph_I40]
MSESKIVKGTPAEISPELLDKLENVFSATQAMYKEGDTLDSVAFRAGQTSVVEWIKRHARTTIRPI